MTRMQLEHIIRAASSISGENRIVDCLFVVYPCVGC